VPHDLRGNLAMPRRRQIEMNFRLKCWPLAGSADQVNDLGLDGPNISLISINRIYMTPNGKDGRRFSVTPSVIDLVKAGYVGCHCETTAAFETLYMRS
jgi:hypothetical protein